jgi:hypothetical protein
MIIIEAPLALLLIASPLLYPPGTINKMTAMKLLSLAGVGAAAAAASSSITAVAASSSPVLSRRTSSSTTAITPSTRTLADYAYLESLSGYSLQYSHCVRVKIPEKYDDDTVEGNVNFYNGRYHAQYTAYATFHVCGDGDYDSSAQCSASSCDYDVEYAAPLGEYLQTSLEHWQRACEECQRDGSSCPSSCANFANDNDNNNNNGNADESQYTECVAAYQEDGMQLYYGPQCSDDGTSIVVGVFYDDECAIKAKYDPPSFEYAKFGAVQSGCVDCTSDQGQDACNDLYGESYHCLNGKDQRGQDNEMSVCSTVKKAMTSVDYSRVKKRNSGADLFLKVFLTLLALSMVGGMLFLSYAYYVRHKKHDESLAERMDADQREATADYAGYEEGGGENPMGGGILS